MEKATQCIVMIIVMAIAIITTSCVTPGVQHSVCDDITQPSYLCDMSKAMGVRLEEVGNTFIIANSLAIASGKYTKEDAAREINRLVLILDDPISYMEFRFNVEEVLHEFPGLLEVARAYLDTFVQPDFIFKTDRNIMTSWLRRQLANLEG